MIEPLAAMSERAESKLDQASSKVDGLVVELEVLRGIVARITDGWDFVMPDAAGERHVWWRLQDGAGEFVSSPDGLQQEPMTPAEVHAIYGTKGGG